MSDQIVKNLSQTEDTPFEYGVPQSVEWMLQSIIATYDGSAAGVDFLPGVEIVGPGGVTTGIFVDPNVKITAGSSGTVTFGPFLRSPSGGSTPGGGITRIQSPSGSISVAHPTGPTTNIDVASIPMLAERADGTTGPVAAGTSFVSFAHGAGDSLLDYTTPTQPTIRFDGWYAVAAAGSISGVIAVGSNAELRIFQAGSSSYGSQVISTTIPGDGTAAGVEISVTGTPWKLNGGDQLLVPFIHNNAAALTAGVGLYVTKVTA